MPSKVYSVLLRRGAPVIGTGMDLPRAAGWTVGGRARLPSVMRSEDSVGWASPLRHAGDVDPGTWNGPAVAHDGPCFGLRHGIRSALVQEELSGTRRTVKQRDVVPVSEARQQKPNGDNHLVCRRDRGWAARVFKGGLLGRAYTEDPDPVRALFLAKAALGEAVPAGFSFAQPWAGPDSSDLPSRGAESCFSATRSHTTGCSTLPSAQPWESWTRRQAKRPVMGPFVPSRRVTVCRASSGSPFAASRTLCGWGRLPCFAAVLPVLGPLFGKVQAEVQRHTRIVRGVIQANPHLAVPKLAERPRILACRPNRVLALLRNFMPGLGYRGT